MTNTRKWIVSSTTIISLLTSFVVATAQNPSMGSVSGSGGTQTPSVNAVRPQGGGNGGGGRAQSTAPTTTGEYRYNVLSSEMGFDTSVIKGAPFSATATSESTQALADGNKITHKSVSTLYRDGQGRTRREQTLSNIGNYATSSDALQTIFINDPIGGFNYVLSPRDHTAQKSSNTMNVVRATGSVSGGFGSSANSVSTRPTMQASGSGGGSSVSRPTLTANQVAPAGGRVESGQASYMVKQEGPKPEVIQLGKQSFEGVEAEGIKTITTIPAGQIGNEQPIIIENERWYSPELQLTIMTRHSDPRFGETIYKLTNINRNEPDHSLFEVPSDYTVKEIPTMKAGVLKKTPDQE